MSILADDKWGKFGKVFGDVSEYMYIYIIVLFAIVALITALIVSYVMRSKKQNSESSEQKRSVIGRIIIYVLAGVLLLVLSPLILGIFL